MHFTRCSFTTPPSIILSCCTAHVQFVASCSQLYCTIQVLFNIYINTCTLWMEYALDRMLFSFSNFAYKKRKHLSSLGKEKENSSEEIEQEAITPIKAHQETIPETPSPLLPSSIKTSSEKLPVAKKKRRQFARIESSDDEEYLNSREKKKDINNVHAQKRRKLTDSFDDCQSSHSNSTQGENILKNDTIPHQIIISDSSQSSNSDSDHQEIKQKGKHKNARSAHFHSDSESDTSTNISTAVKNVSVASDHTSPGWLCSSRKKLQKFSYKKESQTINSDDDEIMIKPRKRKKKPKKLILIESDSDDSTPVRTVKEQVSLKTRQSLSLPKSCITIDDKLIELDQYSGPDSDEEGFTETQKKGILKFMNESSIEELSDIPGCSQGKAAMVDNSRPFKTWEQLVRLYCAYSQLKLLYSYFVCEE